MDLIDPKPEAPREFRGEFNVIPTRIPDFHVSELMPCTAAIADRLIFVRSLVGAESRHDAFQLVRPALTPKTWNPSVGAPPWVRS